MFLLIVMIFNLQIIKRHLSLAYHTKISNQLTVLHAVFLDWLEIRSWNKILIYQELYLGWKQIVLSDTDYTSLFYTLVKLTNTASLEFHMTQSGVFSGSTQALQQKAVQMRVMSEGKKVREGLPSNINHFLKWDTRPFFFQQLSKHCISVNGSNLMLVCKETRANLLFVLTNTSFVQTRSTDG